MPPTAREELIKEFQELVEICPPDCSCSEVIAHFILANYVKKECLEPLVNTENKINLIVKTDTERRRYAQKFNEMRKKAIDETLKLAKGE